MTKEQKMRKALGIKLNYNHCKVCNWPDDNLDIRNICSDCNTSKYRDCICCGFRLHNDRKVCPNCIYEGKGKRSWND